MDVSFHPAVKKSPSQPCLTLNIPKNPAGSVGNAALMAVTHFKGSHSPGGGQTTCASLGYPSPPQSTCDTSRPPAFSQPPARHPGHPTASPRQSPRSMRLLEHRLGQGSSMWDVCLRETGRQRLPFPRRIMSPHNPSAGSDAKTQPGTGMFPHGMGCTPSLPHLHGRRGTTAIQERATSRSQLSPQRLQVSEGYAGTWQGGSRR